MGNNQTRIYQTFKYSIRLEDRSIAAEHESISGFLMEIKLEEDDEEGACLATTTVGHISGLLLTSDFMERNGIYDALDSENGELEEIASCLLAIEESQNDDFEEVMSFGHGYLIIQHLYFKPEFERTGVEQSSLKTLISKLGALTHGVIVYPLKEIHKKKKDATIDFDRSRQGMAYIQKVFRDVGFRPIDGEPFWAFWSIYQSPEMEQLPALGAFDLTERRFEVNEEEVFEYKQPG